MKRVLLSALTFCFCSAAFATSVITTQLNDPKAVYLDLPAPGADSSAALQAAIDRAANTAREGIIFVRSGRHSLTRTIYFWPGVRVIGYGETRPVFELPADTLGFQKGMGVMVMSTGFGPNLPARRGFSIPFRLPDPSRRITE